ncbi:unnamed protein product [Mesocestoides corti]|nr:unnamed protein product [Mesocestoides corti]
MSDYSRRMASRNRKQRFPHPDRRRSSSFLPSSPFSENGYDSDENVYPPSKRMRSSVGYVSRGPVATKGHPSDVIKSENKELNSSSGPPSRIDKRARDEHNEQERSRRRELAVIYELIRCSFSQDDLRHLGPGNAPKSIDKLSYPQVLHIAYHVIKEENHNLQLFERTLADIKRIEKEFLRLGLPVPCRPTCPSVTDTYKKVVGVVDALLKIDKQARALDGSYEITPAQRAAYGDHQLAFLRPKTLHGHLSSPDSVSPPPPFYSHSDSHSVASSNSSSYNHDRRTISQHTNGFHRPTPRTPGYSAVSSHRVHPPLATTARQPTSDPFVQQMPTPSSSSSSLPQICTVFKSSPSLPTADHDEVISTRNSGGMEYIDEVDLPPIADSLSVANGEMGTTGVCDDLYFFGGDMGVTGGDRDDLLPDADIPPSIFSGIPL